MLILMFVLVICWIYFGQTCVYPGFFGYIYIYICIYTYSLNNTFIRVTLDGMFFNAAICSLCSLSCLGRPPHKGIGKAAAAAPRLAAAVTSPVKKA